MKNIFKFLTIAAIATSLTSCEEDLIVFDPVNGQELVGFSSAAYDLPIEIDATGALQVEVDVSNVSTSDRTFSISVIDDEENTTVDPSVYTVPNSVTVPAGSNKGVFTIDGVDNGVETTPETLVLEIAGNAGSVLSIQRATVSVFEVCPLGEGVTFTGDYRINLFGGSGLFGCSVFPDDGVVTINATSDFDRSFEAQYILDCGFGSFPTDFEFSLICFETVFKFVDTGVGCGGNDVNLSVDQGSFAGQYDPADDSSFTVIITDNVESDCGGGPVLSGYTFTKL
ncbi:hypothetical protein [uncultured Winogradskyella sp.]|uniref:hypothetical protein n=1 Tax=uncultured Winogradskyella sp. TaxID=395353 RepID=UPI00260F8D11|nr:hypothetical protein [uncultured Winogradskyella sp.]